jgi:hypothetical protein
MLEEKEFTNRVQGAALRVGEKEKEKQHGEGKVGEKKIRA